MGNPPKFKRALYRPNPGKRGARVARGGGDSVFLRLWGGGEREELES